MGVDHVVDLKEGGVIESIKAFLKTRKLKGVDVLYDPVGGKLTKESMKLLNWGAQILVIGFASGEVPIIPANIALVKASATLSPALETSIDYHLKVLLIAIGYGGPSLFHYKDQFKEAIHSAFESPSWKVNIAGDQIVA